MVGGDGRDVGSGGYEVLGQRGRLEVAVLVVDGLLEQRLGQSGRSWAVKAAKAMAASGSDLSGVPDTVNVPSRNSRSSSLASSWWAAIVRALSITRSHAMSIATPPTASEREP